MSLPEPPPPADPAPMQWADFLADQLPGKTRNVEGFTDPIQRTHLRRSSLDVQCHHCKKRATSYAEGRDLNQPGKWSEVHLNLVCQGCLSQVKRLWLNVKLGDPQSPDGHRNGQAMKIAEYPPFSPRIPHELRAFVGSDYELFRQGKLCEALGLGIGALTYYRRLIDGQRKRHE